MEINVKHRPFRCLAMSLGLKHRPHRLLADVPGTFSWRLIWIFCEHRRFSGFVVCASFSMFSMCLVHRCTQRFVWSSFCQTLCYLQMNCFHWRLSRLLARIWFPIACALGGPIFCSNRSSRWPLSSNFSSWVPCLTFQLEFQLRSSSYAAIDAWYALRYPCFARFLCPCPFHSVDSFRLNLKWTYSLRWFSILVAMGWWKWNGDWRIEKKNETKANKMCSVRFNCENMCLFEYFWNLATKIRQKMDDNVHLLLNMMNNVLYWCFICTQHTNLLTKLILKALLFRVSDVIS